MKRLALLVLALAACSQGTETPKPSGGGTGNPSPQGGRPPARKARITVAEAAQREIVTIVEAAGSIEPSEEISIPAQVNGIVDDVHFKEGDVVDTKKVLVQIDLDKFRLAVAKAEADLDRVEAQETLARTLHDNRLKLYEEGKKRDKEWVTEEQMAQWRADLAKATADVKRVTAELDLAKKELSRAEVRPPTAGLINRKSVAKGEYVKVDTIVAVILNVNPLHVRFAVPEVEASRLVMGQDVEFRVKSAPADLFKAKLFYMSQKADVTTRTVECKAEIAGTPKLRPGFFAEVTLKTGAKQGVIVPERCVLPSDRGFLIYVLEGTRVKQRVVRLGLRTSDGVEVVDNLKAGEKVAADGAAALKDGAEVEVVTEGPKK